MSSSSSSTSIMFTWKASSLLVALVAVVSAVLVREFGSIERLALAKQLNCESDATVAFDGRLYYFHPLHHQEEDLDTPSSPLLHIHPCAVFSNSYVQARQRFREAVNQLPFAKLVTIPIPEQQEKNEEEEQVPLYTIDLAILPGTHHYHSKDWLVHSSGTHGVEGYAGSAIQLAYLQHRYELYQQQQQEESSSFSSSSSPNAVAAFPNVLLVHAINPFGMHHFRRANEHNVDLNRNALNATGWQQARSTEQRAPVIEDYNSLHVTFFNPPHAPTLWFYHVQVWYQALLALLQFGYGTVKRAMVAGQYHEPRGIFYGGNGTLEPSLQRLWDVLQQYDILPKSSQQQQQQQSSDDDDDDDDEKASYIPTLTWIDVHTGLGPSGDDTMLFTNRKETKEEEEAYQQYVAQTFPGSLFPPTAMGATTATSTAAAATTTTTASSSSKPPNADAGSKAAEQVMAGYDYSIGFVTDFVHEEWKKTIPKTTTRTIHTNSTAASSPPPPPPIMTVTQEIGTISSLLVARAFIVENMAWQFLGTEGPTTTAWAQFTTRAAFYPNSPAWRAKVLQNGLRVLYQAHARYTILDNSSKAQEQNQEVEDVEEE